MCIRDRIFGVNTIPACRKQGYAGQLLQQAIADARAQGRKGLILTCKEALVHYLSLIHISLSLLNAVTSHMPPCMALR